MKTNINQSFKWYEVRNAITPTNGAYCDPYNKTTYQFQTPQEAKKIITALCKVKGSNYKEEDFQIVEIRSSVKSI